MLDPGIVRRLAFARYVYLQGVQQAAAPEPLCATAILPLHDAVEMFLVVACEHLNAIPGKKNPEFMEYWPALSGRLPGGVSLGHETSMRRFNRVRVDLKHHGVQPHRADVTYFKDVVTAFFESSTPQVFGIDFDSVSLSDFVQPDAAKDAVREAERLVAGGDYKGSIGQSATAFALMLGDYEDRKRSIWGSPFTFGRDPRYGPAASLAEVPESLVRTIEELRGTVRILSLGVDYRRYARFKYLSPITARIPGLRGVGLQERPGAPVPTADDARFCIDFVIETAVRLREFDFDIERPPSLRNPERNVL